MSASRIQIGEDVIFQPLDNEVVLLNLTSQQYFGLNDVGTEMWKLLVQHGDAATVVDRLSEEYAVDKNTLLSDLTILIQNLEAAGLVKSVAA